jgi:Mitochondrial biogenesis AIM24
MLGDLSLLRLTGKEEWSVGKESFVACTQGIIKDYKSQSIIKDYKSQSIIKDYKSQSISKALFSGKGLFVCKMSGTGIVWFTSFGAIIKKDVCSTCSYLLTLTLSSPLQLTLLFAPSSSKKANTTSSTAATWSHRAASTYSSASHLAASSPASRAAMA